MLIHRHSGAGRARVGKLTRFPAVIVLSLAVAPPAMAEAPEVAVRGLVAGELVVPGLVASDLAAPGLAAPILVTRVAGVSELAATMLATTMTETLGLAPTPDIASDPALPIWSTPVSTKGAVVVGCEGITMSGSAKIDAWNSRDGLYSPALATDNTLVATVGPNADIQITGHANIRADLLAVRDLLISNGQSLSGDLFAGRNIVFTNNPPCPPEGVHAGGTISTPGQWWLNGCGGGADWVQHAEITLPRLECDPLDVTGLVSGMIAEYAPQGEVQPWPYPGWRANPVEIDANGSYDAFTVASGNQPLMIDATKVDYLYIDGNFHITSGGRLHIRNPHGLSQIQELRIIVDGNFTTDGGSLLVIDPGISVRAYITGQVTIGGGAGQDVPPSIEIDGKIQPTFGIYTSHESQTSAYGVRVIATSPLTAVVYAPRANVQVGESGHVYGAVRGRTVHVTGSGWIHYDENFDINSNWDGGPIFETDLSVSLAIDTTKVEYNRDLTLTVSVYGGDAGLFEGVTLGVELPSDLIYVSHQAPAGTSFLDLSGDGIPDTWQVDTVLAQETRVLQVVMRGPNRPDTALARFNVALSDWSGSADTYPENNVDSLGVHILPSPLLTLTKAASVESLVPGEVIGYTTTLMNLAEAPAHHVLVSGKIDRELALKIDAFGDEIPFRFVDGEAPSGLQLGTLEFSNDDGATWSYTPVSGGGGAPGGYDAAVTHWRITMVGVMNPKSSFQIEYQALLPWTEAGVTSK